MSGNPFSLHISIDFSPSDWGNAVIVIAILMLTFVGGVAGIIGAWRNV